MRIGFLIIENGYKFLGEAAYVINDTLDGKKVRKKEEIDENLPLNSRKEELKKKSPDTHLPKPEISDYIFEKDFIAKDSPTQGVFDGYSVDLREMRHGFNHDAKNSKEMRLRKVYDTMEAAMKRRRKE